jgi:hypothetical protein
MANSPLLGGERAAARPKGTDTEALGPSDTSDSGSDITGAVGAVETDELGFDGGSNDDVRRAPGAGADIGDPDLDGASDSGGTGERAEAGRDTLRQDAPDLMPDQIVSIGDEDTGLTGDLDIDELAADATDEGDEDSDEVDVDADLAPRSGDGRGGMRSPQRTAGAGRPQASGGDQRSGKSGDD